MTTQGSVGDQLRRILGLALLVGTVYGFAEAVLATVLSLIPGALSWRNGNSTQALLFMPPFYVLFFTAITLPVLLLATIVRRVPWDRLWFAALVGYCGYLAAALQGEVFSDFSAIMLGLGFATVTFRWYSGKKNILSRLPRVISWTFGSVMAVGLLVNGAVLGWEHWRLARLPLALAGAPNVLLLVLDTQRADHLETYGYSRATSPEVSELAREGTLYESAYAPSSWTLPSHASMFTGRPLHEHGSGDRGRRYLDRRYPVLAEAMAKEGYATGGFVANRFWTGRNSGLARGFIHYEDFYGSLGDGINRTVVGLRLLNKIRPKLGMVDIPGRKRTDQVNANMLDWVDGLGRRPFFIFCNYFDVHAPFVPPNEVLGVFGGNLQMDADEGADIGRWDDVQGKPTEAKLLRWITRYDESLLFMDRHIGSMLDSLKSRGLLDNTIVILTSDHGEDFGEKGLVHHGNSLYLTELRVPLIVRFPPSFAAGVRVTAPVSLADIPATIAGLTPVPDSAFPGPSLLAATGPTAHERAVLSEVARRPEVPKTWPAGRGWIKSYTTAKWHFILEQSGDAELYDMDRDSAEERNLARQPENAQVVSHFRDMMRTLLPRSDSTGNSRDAASRQRRSPCC